MLRGSFNVWHGFKYILRDKLPQILNLIVELTVEKSGLEYLETALRYLSQGARALTVSELRAAVQEVMYEDDDLMTTIAETLIEQGRVEGKVEGKVEGLRENLLESIEILLEVRFGVKGLLLLPEIKQITDVSMLQIVQKSLRSVATTDELRALYRSSLP